MTNSPIATVKKHLKTLGEPVYILCSLIFLGALLVNHFQLITTSSPLDYYEAAMPTITETLSTGGNPYTLDNQPARASVYPVLYNTIVAPLTYIFGNTLELHRLVVGLFILLSCILCFLASRKSGLSLSHSLAAATLIYSGLLFYSTPIASPNSTGLFFFLACILIPWFFHFSNKSLVASVVLGLLAFYSTLR